ncbi:MAG: hypothetical protein IJ899_12585 [Blautia sp.]|nr:hypothetical protein [Blautia sp.]
MDIKRDRLSDASPRLFQCIIFCIAICISFFLCACANGDKQKIRSVLSNEFGLLRDLDQETVQAYINHGTLLSLSQMTVSLPGDVCTLFFEHFDFSIGKIKVNASDNTATANVKLTTINARPLAKDYVGLLIREEMLTANSSSLQSSPDNLASSPDEAPYVNSMLSDDDSSASAAGLLKTKSVSHAAVSEERQLAILSNLLSDNDYGTIQKTCTIYLTKNTSGEWKIPHSKRLEDYLTGGLLTLLSDPYLLSPEETISICFDAIKDMDISALSAFMGFSGLIQDQSSFSGQIGFQLAGQVCELFDYEIISCTRERNEAVCTVLITSFDSEAILRSYTESLNKYLSSPAAVIDGEEKRYRYSCNLMLSILSENRQTRTSKCVFQFVNNGARWQFTEESAAVLGEALFSRSLDVQ